MNHRNNTRRKFITSSVLGTVALSVPASPSSIFDEPKNIFSKNDLFYRYPAIHDDVVSEVVGASHFNFERVKELVDQRPELARATWDWGFGDWETALGAASHVGRKDIAEYLMGMGARADIFTFAMLGKYEVVKTMVEAMPGIQKVAGPHGISLLQHAEAGQRPDNLTKAEKEGLNKLIDYLEGLGDADVQEKYLKMEDGDKEKYLGDYKYGDGPEDGFTIRLNMRKLLSLGKIGKFGGALYQLGENKFRYNGAPSVEITFNVKNEKVLSLTVHEPDFILTALKVNGGN